MISAQFHQAQQEKSRKALSDARELQAFLCSQMAEKRQKKRLEEEEDQLFNTHNQHLQQVLCMIHSHSMSLSLSLSLSLSGHRWNSSSSKNMQIQFYLKPGSEELRLKCWSMQQLSGREEAEAPPLLGFSPATRFFFPTP